MNIFQPGEAGVIAAKAPDRGMPVATLCTFADKNEEQQIAEQARLRQKDRPVFVDRGQPVRGQQEKDGHRIRRQEVQVGWSATGKNPEENAHEDDPER
ncbi:hypothetical protein N7492_009706 [Penicillium capsulatum]|uniref:Uncharacterized protein n=1 Tax=Penicillium capsulatum TaxID=69766 RepID=A0A9W9HMW7_9EURO|nr:hypothetical protein N7492_009706 [Penicillium capsulatum]KAJ6114213.1 hypothetical protein N7512_007658 [Penicillium capsulatum]